MGIYLFETSPTNADKLRSLLKSKRLKIIKEYDLSDMGMYIIKVDCTFRSFTSLASLSLSNSSFVFSISKDKIPELQKKIVKNTEVHT